MVRQTDPSFPGTREGEYSSQVSHTAPYGDRGLVSNTGLLQLTPGFPLGILKSMGTLVTACCTSFLTLQASVVDL